MAYARVGALCEAIKAELNNDLKIHDQGILPQFINLPQVTAGEYCRVSPPAQLNDAIYDGHTCAIKLASNHEAPKCHLHQLSSPDAWTPFGLLHS